MNYADHLDGWCLRQHRGHLCGVEDLSPRSIDSVQHAPRSLDDVGHAVAENPIDADQNRIAWFDDVYQSCLHTGATGARDRDRQRIGRAKDLAESALRGVHDGEEFGIEVSVEGASQSLVDPWMHHGWTGAEQDSPRLGERFG